MHVSSTARTLRASACRGAALVLLLPCLLLGACENVSLGDVTPALEDDSPLANAVRARLDTTPQLRGLIIRVKSLDGETIRLSGSVPNAGQRADAERIALSVPGVRSVVNSLFLRD